MVGAHVAERGEAGLLAAECGEVNVERSRDRACGVRLGLAVPHQPHHHRLQREEGVDVHASRVDSAKDSADVCDCISLGIGAIGAQAFERLDDHALQRARNVIGTYPLVRLLAGARAGTPGDVLVGMGIAMARAGVVMARANLERTETLLRYAHVTAPFAGIVRAPVRKGVTHPS